MNAAILLMSSATLAGADPAPAAHPPAAPVVISSGAGCSNCGTAAAYYAPSDCGCGKAGLLDRFKARFGRKSADCCTPAPCCAPASACDPCHKSAADRPNLLDKLKSRWGGKRSACCDPCATTYVDPCATTHAVAAPPATTPPVTGGTTPPKEMPKPKDPKDSKDSKDKGKGGNTGGVSVPAPPTVSGAGLTTPASPY